MAQKQKSQSALINMQDVSFAYSGNAPVLRGVSLAIRPQSFQYLTGSSGAGKTSLLKIMSLGLRPTAGTMQVFGASAFDVTAHDIPHIRQKIGMVFQDFRLLDHLTVFENVALTLRVRGAWQADNATDVKDLLEWVGLGDKLLMYPPMLSGGEQQRVAIARALIAKPAILLADEPTGNVDPIMGRRLLRLFVELHKLGTAVLIATHDMSLIKLYPAPCFALEDGYIIHRPAA